MVILGVVVFLIVFFLMRNPMPKVVARTNECPPHKWQYDAHERLICGTCSMRPGEATTKNGEY